jgi:triacylglycerol esterase/lipase EstA (alpha/beta hydrolase family)
MSLYPGFSRWIGSLIAISLLSGCSILQQFEDRVTVNAMKPSEYIARKRGDILTAGKLSQATLETIKVSALEDICSASDKPPRDCIGALARVTSVDEERRLSALSELWVQQAVLLRTKKQVGTDDEQIDAWLEAARHAFAYLFFTERNPGQRAFEDRQTQVRDYYNLAVQEVSSILFVRQRTSEDADDPNAAIRIGTWLIQPDLSQLPKSRGQRQLKELIPASTIAFTGLRSEYRRDGFGAELVAAIDAENSASTSAVVGQVNRDVHRSRQRDASWSAMPYRVLTALAHFPGRTVTEILSTHEVSIPVYDPYEHKQLKINNQQVPLAGQFTAGYGLWLARSGFARQSIRTLLGREQSIERPHLYLMQPYDPARRVVVLIHGLASSPEAWVNVANEIMGDERLRQRYQIWQIYYPTNFPVAVSHFQIRNTIQSVLRHFDPDHTAPASRDMVLVGHSMGGLIARLMVSSSESTAMSQLIEGSDLNSRRKLRLQARLGQLINFKPMPQVRRAIFLAAPHQGTPIARNRLSMLLAQIIRLPLTILQDLTDPVLDGDAAAPGQTPIRLPNSIDNLRDDDQFIRAAANIPISQGVKYHSIIARVSADGALEDTNDGLVPYRSSHLSGAVSEKVIVSGHSVQETASAILELRRILHADLVE